MSPEDNQHKSVVAQKEEEVLSFWNTHNIFKKSLEKKSPKGNFIFYDGPPFATGLPHYGHLLASIIKDAIPRYKTMRGYHVRRQWGWDCHGLPIENLIEKELGLEKKKDIEKLGIEEFNRAAKNSVLRYDSEWKKIIPRVGRWVDMEQGYKTMDASYTESIWWVFKTLYDKKLVYEGYKSMHICPRCETTLAASEVSMGYKDITDISVIVKFELEGEPETYLLAWTTTPWTLPGNVALAVGEEIEYVKISVENDEEGKVERFILAKDRLDTIRADHEVLEIFKGKQLVKKKYKPLFNYYSDSSKLKNKENGWKIYAAQFVNTEDGTGIVHIAPAFGEDDMELGVRHKLPFVQHVLNDGTFASKVLDFKGLAVKPKHNPQATDIEIIKHLSHKKQLFGKEKITHTYPFCWRCDTPLLNYAASSWFVKVTALKRKLLDVNKKIKWVPAYIQHGRFGKWLEGARDWAVSRSRFWGAPIPVWRCSDCKKIEVIGSVDDIKKKTTSSGNAYIVMRHGEAQSNKAGFVNSEIDEKNGLTEDGKSEALKTAKMLKGKNIDLIFSSPIPRTMETARIVAKTIGISAEHVLVDERLKEILVGNFEGKSNEEYRAYFTSTKERFTKRPEGGENMLDVKKRVGSFLESVESQYENKNILFVTHEYPSWQIISVAEGWDIDESIKARETKVDFIETAQSVPFPYDNIPRNTDYELDLHRPFVDYVEFPCVCGKTMKRISEVFDCWFESGSMPFAQFHYPFKNKKVFKKNFPAHFIAEGLDQTRGWFYNVLVLSVGLFGKTAYHNVIVNGLILAEDGQKMSKKLKNYPDPTALIDVYGADALRYYLLSSPVVRGESVNFSEKDVREVMNKIITRLRNVCAFYELYNNANLQPKTHNPTKGEARQRRLKPKSTNVLDQWVCVRLSELINQVTYAAEEYKLDRATRPISEFIDDLSTWYIRRSRDRFKKGNKKDVCDALATTHFVLVELSKIIAPFTPFIADEIYRKLHVVDGEESVHLTLWSKEEPAIPIWPNPMALFHRLFGTHEDLRILSDMQKVRDIVSLALEARMKEGIKVRQPLKELRIRKQELRIKDNEQLVGLIKDEVNVKEVIFGVRIENDIELDTKITEDLKKEGQLREFVRYIQDLRKKEGLFPSQKVNLIVYTGETGKAFIGMFEQEFKNSVSVNDISFGATEGERIKVGDLEFIVKIN